MKVKTIVIACSIKQQAVMQRTLYHAITLGQVLKDSRFPFQARKALATPLI